MERASIMTGKDPRSRGRGELEPLADLIDQLGSAGRFTGEAKQSFAREVARWNAEDLGRRAMILCAGNRRCAGGLARGAAGQAEGMS